MLSTHKATMINCLPTPSRKCHVNPTINTLPAGGDIGQHWKNIWGIEPAIKTATFHPMLTKEIKSLSKSEKLLLINDLWDDISEEMEHSELSDSEIRLLDERWAELEKNPDEGKPWSEVKKALEDLL